MSAQSQRRYRVQNSRLRPNVDLSECRSIFENVKRRVSTLLCCHKKWESARRCCDPFDKAGAMGRAFPS